MDRSAGRSPHWDASEVPVDRVAVPKDGQKNALPRENATEMVVGGGAVPKTSQSIGYLPVMDRPAGRSPHWDASEVPVGRGGRAKDRPKTSRRADS
ncbi:MAG: hypothetical protein PUH82_08375 [Bacteroidales bacterium]|uniref:hypothetical protein n=1 Tax=Candidatus Cryptobacteroides sp. TaxID=2952915 RepID=UPI002A91E118|nr:hypothetical protein [Candidatus Cryptobacteroides sp.]MDD7136353.1 hypothetical protein [Bacteroidales bacterium]MDY5566863.1 hypothetical protein [Candidatus Cryptobacteroides sp.]